MDSCDTIPDGSNLFPVRIPANEEDLDDGEDDDEEGELQSKPSIQVSTWVKPNDAFINTKDEFSKQAEHNYIPLMELSQFPFNTQQKLKQEFPLPHESVTTTESLTLGDSKIRNTFMPPPPLLKEPDHTEGSFSGMNKTFA